MQQSAPVAKPVRKTLVEVQYLGPKGKVVGREYLHLAKSQCKEAQSETGTFISAHEQETHRLSAVRKATFGFIFRMEPAKH